MNLFKEQSPSNRSTKHACNWGPRSAGIKHPAHSNIIPQKRSLEIPIKKTHSKQPNHPRKKRKILHHIQNNTACNNTDAIRWQIHLKQRTAVECVRPTLKTNASIHAEAIKNEPPSSSNTKPAVSDLLSDSGEDDTIWNPPEETETHTTPITSDITANTVQEGAWMFSLCVEEVFRTRAATAGEIIPMIKVITTNKSKLLFHERCDQMVWFQRRGTMPRMYCQCIKNNTYQTLSSEDVDLRFVSPNRNRKKKELILFRKQLNRQKPVFINPNVFDGKYVIGLKVLAVLEPFGGGTIIKSRIVKVRVPSGDSFSTSSTVPPLTSSTDTPTQSVSSISHNSINPSEKQCTLITTTTTADTTNEATGENTNETAVKEEEEKQNECEASTTATASVMKTQSDEASSQQQVQTTVTIPQPQLSAQELPQSQPLQHHQVQQQQQLFGAVDPKKQPLQQYTYWPPYSEKQYLSYQISNYLGQTASMVNPSSFAPTAALNHINNMIAMQSTASNALSLGINPLVAAQASAVQNPLLAAMMGMQTARNPLLAANMSAASVSNNTAMSGKQYSLFVFRLPGDIDDHGLLQLFAPYGAVRSNVMRHDMGRSRGFGFVYFNTRHEAQIAIDMMNGYKIGRKRLEVSFKRERNIVTRASDAT